jgi:hypothetical protein
VLGSVLLLALFLPRPVPAQEIGVFAGKGWSDQREAGDPSSLGVRAQYFPVPRFGARIEYTRYEARPRWSATTCEVGFPFNEGCLVETVENRTELRSYDFSLVAVPVLHDAWRLEVGLGVASNDLENEVRGVETGRFVYSDANYDPPSGDLLSFLSGRGDGLVPSVTLTRLGIAQLPIALGVSWRHRSVEHPPCGTDGDCLYHENFGLHELALHGSWRF